MIVAMLALFLAMGGTAIAASSALITGKQIKNSSITGADVKNKSLTPKDFRGSVRGPRGAAGPAGPTGAAGAQGAQGVQGVQGIQGLRGPSDAYEQAQSNTFVSGLSNTTKTLTLAGLPAGAYVVTGKAQVGPTGGTTNNFVGHCTLTAGPGAGQTIDVSYERLEDGWFGHINTQLTHVFSSTGTVTMACGLNGASYVIGSVAGDTKIIAIRVDNRTKGTTPLSSFSAELSPNSGSTRK